jgi:hypothetical protein
VVTFSETILPAASNLITVVVVVTTTSLPRLAVCVRVLVRVFNGPAAVCQCDMISYYHTF